MTNTCQQVKTNENVIKQPKERIKQDDFTKINMNRLKNFITRDEWRIFKKHCIDINIPVYKQLGRLLKNYLKEKQLF